MTAPAKVEVISASEDKAVMMFAIHEGRNRQIRRMCEVVGLFVTRLKRVSVGKIYLGSLPVGKWRLLTKPEIDYLKQL